MPAGEEYRWQGVTVACMPIDVLREPALSGSWSSSLEGHDGSATTLGPASKKRGQSDSRGPELISPVSKRERGAGNASEMFGRLLSQQRPKPLWELQDTIEAVRTRENTKDEAGPIALDLVRQPQAVSEKFPSASSRRHESDKRSKGMQVPEENNYSDLDTDNQKKWKFQVVRSLRVRPCLQACNLIGAIDFDQSGSRFATGGIARKIRICSYNAQFDDNLKSDVADDEDFEEDEDNGQRGYRSRKCRKRRQSIEDGVLIEDHNRAALKVICTPAKLSSLRWRPLGSNVIGCGDYDGVVTEWDVENGLSVSERYEHNGHRIWSVDYSSWFPFLCASASGDGTVRLWTSNSERSVGVIRSPRRNSICCAQFSSAGPHRVAMACADSNVYVYDVRRLETSLVCLQQHERAASYVRFVGENELVSASIDSTVKLWDVSAASTKERVVRTFDRHTNVRNFVGLCGMMMKKEKKQEEGGGLIACGSETNEVFVYSRLKNRPAWRIKFPTINNSSNCNPFVGAVCWKDQGDHYSLAAANSEGTVQVMRVDF